MTKIIGSLLALSAMPFFANAQAPKPAEPAVAAANRAVFAQLPFTDRQDFADANRGFVATTPDARNPTLYDFLKQDAPPTVNPSLWRQAQLNAINGLFKVTDGVYQVRGFSLANMTIVEGSTGIIVIDTLSTAGAAREALSLYAAQRGRKPVKAIIYSHSHSDHYGGAKGVATDEDVASGATKVFAPAGFMDAIVSESVTGGNAMGRRAQFQFGSPLPRGDRGNVDAGLGKMDSRSSLGAPGGGGGVIAPTDSIEKPIETHTIDGVTIVFQLAPKSEAPSEMQIYLPQSHVLDMAENATHNLHNLLPLRGTEVRDANGWSHYISEALERFGPDAQVLIAQHHWPVWDNARVVKRLQVQRDLYKYVHDQTVRLMNQGYGPADIAEALTMPPGLENEWSARGYYGTLSHDAKAVYQKYLGWYDGNPANLNPLPPAEDARKYVEYMGGASAVIARAREDFKAGNYRWVAQVMDQVVFADPANKEARALAADAFEQLGYVTESATWRNAYLLGAQELRAATPSQTRPAPGVGADMLHAMPLNLVFDYLATRVNGPRAGTSHIVMNWKFTDSRESIASNLEHGALTAVLNKTDPAATATVTTTRPVFEAIILGQRPLAESLRNNAVSVTGDAAQLTTLMALLDSFEAGFPIIEPR
ncbi:MAG TPA: alkyl sulfatase dimerization domain-containing protein [Bryobacteraceae bacterium]|jgi:alkyl sulfatase BDS1-like metallo-beta-lactamase superfamily hydrolase|nr:alkyl sulfatase dimerization domain-containing protein [Bryobacteraceae bacterium]